MKLAEYLRSVQRQDVHVQNYWFLAVLRVLLVLIPQSGYIHPDEFFQSLEVMAGDEYGLEHTRTWEFNHTMPIRSIAIPYLTIRIPLNFLRFISIYSRIYLNIDLRTSYVLLVYPRLVMVALSFVNDWSLYRICRSYNLHSQVRLAAMAGSYVLLVFGSRTFSNTIEMALCSLLLYVVAECMAHSNTVIFQLHILREKYDTAANTVEKVKLYKMMASLPAHSLNSVFAIATICVTGFFNRPTFLAFGMPAVFFWLIRGLGHSRHTTFVDFNIRCALLFVCAIPTICVFITIDSLYYGYLSPIEIQNLMIGMNNFVVTPLNFLRYNLDPKNTAGHGVHSWWTHLVVNIPMLFNVLGVAAIVSFSLMMIQFARARFRGLPRAQSVVALMNASIFVPVLLLSQFNHQEPRFLLALTLPVILLHAPKLEKGFITAHHLSGIKNELVKKCLQLFVSRAVGDGKTNGHLSLWYLSNLLLAAFFGFVHQGGILPLTAHLSDTLRTQQMYHNHVQTHLVTSHIYSIPKSLLFMPSTKTILTNPDTGQKYHRSQKLFLYEYGSLDMDHLYRKLKLILDQNEARAAANPNHRYALLLAIPSSMSEELSLAFWRSNSTLVRHERQRVFYPHLSTEAMPRFTVRHPMEVRSSIFSKEALAADLKCTLHRETNHGRSEMWHEKSPSDMVSSVLWHISSIGHQFGLALYRIEPGYHSQRLSPNQ